MVTGTNVSAIVSPSETTIKESAHPLRAFSMSDQANHLFSCEESFEACAVGIVVVNDHRSAILPHNRLGSREHLSKQFVLVGQFNMDVSTPKLRVTSRLDHILMVADLIMNGIQCLKLDKAIHCLRGGTFHDYVHRTAHGVIIDDVGLFTKELDNF